VPFTQRLWELALQYHDDGGGKAGHIGMITANSFMKREFGKKLIEEFFPTVDLSHLIDTSGAYIPGHGTPTVILFGRSRKPVGDTVRAVMGIKGDPETPDDASNGVVWQSIINQIDIAAARNAYVSTADVDRVTLNTHPWSMGGGGAAELKELLDDAASSTLGSLALSIGFGAILGEEDAFGYPIECRTRIKMSDNMVRPLIEGDHIRDWNLHWSAVAIFPYDDNISLTDDITVLNQLWNCRTLLANRPDFSKQTYAQVGRPFWEYHQIPKDRYRTPLSIAFSAIASHNHFVFDRGGKIFKQSAPIIKLPATATENDYLAILGLLNSSVVCFWLKQVTQIKTQVTGMDSHAWQLRRDIDNTKVKAIPITDGKPLSISRQLDEMAGQIRRRTTLSILAQWHESEDLKTLIEVAEENTLRLRCQMIALQEELDWECYQHYRLLSEDFRYSGDDCPEIALGQRAFEIVMARQMAEGELETGWFERHGSSPITAIPDHWPVRYRKVVERRINVIETNKEISLIEKPEYKRRWIPESWQDQQRLALKSWLLDRLETQKYHKGTKGNPELTTTAQMSDVASADTEFLQVAALFRDRADFDLAVLVAELVEDESVPLLPILRYKPAGLRKRELWEQTWDLQRQQDAGKDVGETPVPPKYASADFLKTDFWRLRGKLDVPKERWISYPHCSTESDPTLVVGWAGWNHLERATALIAYYDARNREGWDAKRLTPLLAGLDQSRRCSNTTPTNLV
jgi:hypothetical protein